MPAMEEKLHQFVQNMVAVPASPLAAAIRESAVISIAAMQRLFSIFSLLQ